MSHSGSMYLGKDGKLIVGRSWYALPVNFCLLTNYIALTYYVEQLLLR